MKLSDAMRKDTRKYPGDGVVGREKPTWYSIGKLKIESDRISVSDLGLMGEERVSVKVSPGDYLIEARLIDFGGSLCISRVRARAQNAEPSIGRKIGNVSVDLAAVVIADYRSMRKSMPEEDLDEFNELVPDCKKGVATMAKLKFENTTVHFAICMSGFGDGTYVVNALR